MALNPIFMPPSGPPPSGRRGPQVEEIPPPPPMWGGPGSGGPPGGMIPAVPEEIAGVWGQVSAVYSNKSFSSDVMRAAAEAVAQPAGGNQSINQRISKAQMNARASSKIQAGQNPKAPAAKQDGLARRHMPAAEQLYNWQPVAPPDFEGAWVDSSGNSVLVRAVDAWRTSYSAALSRPGSGEQRLQIDRTPAGGWRCGNSLLHEGKSSDYELHWVRHDGLTSVWTRGRTGGISQAKDFMGVWIDSLGNSVQVYSVDAWEASLVANVSRPKKGDLHLTISQGFDGASWWCGNAYLDTVASTAEQLHWVRHPSGTVSTWTRGKE
eukprot:gnl/MRDRNA2_/MRDRNA2_75109_c0_seq1.p1 gnl/MRDRNA2_/MRDRNA2_75109_c0~~gnl/MRDRNA2_/MRDRNA2_75109_c0_seq1.p1  ORF type:complete len:322 (+),score=62.52 gnl/MRDRNA2_/MRDRNA2_75109_c0_seq1:121-1086(+)